MTGRRIGRGAGARGQQRDPDRALVTGKAGRTTLGDLAAWGDALGHLAPASRTRKLGALKSLASLGHRIGYLALDVAASLWLPAIKSTRWPSGSLAKATAPAAHPRAPPPEPRPCPGCSTPARAR
jgi:hypothetical protein